MTRPRRTFSTEFKHDAALLVLDQGYSVIEASKSLGNGGRARSFALVDRLSEHEPVELVCEALGISRSSYYDSRRRRKHIDAEKVMLRSKVNQLFNESRSSAGSRTIMGSMREEGYQIGRFKVRSLMRALGLVSKQPGRHAYKSATVERLDIPNHLNREFAVQAPNQAWCGDITYIWAQGRLPLSWICLAVVLWAGRYRVTQMQSWS